MASVWLLLDDRGGTIVLKGAVDDSEEVTVVNVQGTLEEVPIMEKRGIHHLCNATSWSGNASSRA